MDYPEEKNKQLKPIPTLMGLAERCPTKKGTLVFRFRWKRIFFTLATLSVITWLSAAIAIFYYYKEKKHYDEISFSDVLIYPLKRAEIRHAHGEKNIEEAKEALEAADYRKALSLLRTGLSRAPENLEARLLLAQIYQYSSPTVALDLLEKGLPYGGIEDLDYLRQYGRFLSSQRMDTKLIELVKKVQSTPSEVVNDKVMALFAMQAHTRVGQFDEAVYQFNKYELDNNIEGIITAAQALEKQGHRDLAIELLEKFTQRYPGPEVNFARKALAELLSQSGDHQSAIDITLKLSLEAPLEWEPRLQLMYYYKEAGRDEQKQREAHAMVRQFRNEAPAMVALARFAKDDGNIPLARKIYESALENGFQVARFGLLFVETHITAKKYAQCIAFCDEIDAENPDWLNQFRAEFTSMRALAYYGAGNRELGKVYLRELLGLRNPDTNLLYSVSQNFENMDFHLEAFQILLYAYNANESHPAVVAKTVELQIKLGDSQNLTKHIAHLLTLQRPKYSLIENIATELGSDRFVYAAGRAEISQKLNKILEETAGPPAAFKIRVFEEQPATQNKSS